MRLKAPPFWYKPGSVPGHALSPLSLLYRAGHRLHQSFATPFKADIPVICIGNIVAGGSGKTPAALAILQIIKNNMMANAPCFMTRGYGGKMRGHFLVNRDSHTAEDVGDEPLLLAAHAPTIVAPNRRQGARYAMHNHYDLIVMDDGLQNPHLFKDIRFIVIDGRTGFGNRHLLPAGPLREPLNAGLSRADAFIVIGADQTGALAVLPAGKPVFSAEIVVPESWIADKQTPYVAFCGLAHPEKFRNSLAQTGINIAAWHTFPDHYNFAAKDLNHLAEEAKCLGARLITTEKDAVRIPAELARHLPLDVLPVKISWRDEMAVTEFLKQKIATDDKDKISF